MASSDVSAVTKFFATAHEGFSTTLNGTIASGASTVVLNGVSDLVDGSVFVGIIEPAGEKQQVFTGTVDLGNSQITNVKWTRGDNVEHVDGVTIVDYDTGTAFNMVTAGILEAHGQDGFINLAQFNKLWPVGSVYIAVVSTNPNTLLGYGTWVAFAAGKMLVGLDSGDTDFDTVEETGGAKTHDHPLSDNGAAKVHVSATANYGVQIKRITPPTGGTWDATHKAGTETSAAGTATGVSGGSGLFGATDDASSLPPYVTVYMWKRTA